MTYDVEFFYEGHWHFHNQETDRAKAESWAEWLRHQIGVEAHVVGR